MARSKKRAAPGSGAPHESESDEERPAKRLNFSEPEDQPLKVKRLSERATLPRRATAGSAGYDLCSAEDTSIPAGTRKVVKTDLAVSIPARHYGRIAPRSGLAMKQGINVGAGVIDSDYRGKVATTESGYPCQRWWGLRS